MRIANPEKMALNEADFVTNTVTMPSGRPYFRLTFPFARAPRIGKMISRCAVCDAPARYMGVNGEGSPYFYCVPHFRALERQYDQWWFASER